LIELGVRVVVVSNTVFRDGEVYAKDFRSLGWSGWIDGCVTSIDVGAAKPDQQIFAAALECAGAPAAHCVMIGNSERADIVPAVRRGMRAIRVSIEEPLPRTTAADSHATSLLDVVEILRRWKAESPDPH